MKRAIFVRPLSDAECETLKAGLRSPDAFTLRRCQILLASADGKNAYQIATELGCNSQTARDPIHKLNEKGLKEALKQGSKRPHTVHRSFNEEDEKVYTKGRRVSDAEMKTLELERHEVCPAWNYTIRPRLTNA